MPPLYALAMMPDVGTLVEALPYIREFRGKTFVVRCASGLSQDDREALCRDIAILRFVGVKAVLVHPPDDVPAALQDPRQRSNHRLVHEIGAFGKATGLSGSDGAPRWLLSISEDGSISANEDLVLHVIDDYTPVIEAIAVGPDGDVYPADPDIAAAQLAIRLNAYKLLTVIGHDRVTIDGDEVTEMRGSDDVASRIETRPPIDGALRGMLSAIKGGVCFGHLLPGDVPHALLLELFTDRGFGTKIWAPERWPEAPNPHPRGYTLWKDEPE